MSSRDTPTLALAKPVDDARPPGDPAQIGRFSIRGRLGEGGMGVVYVGRDDTLAREVALKLVHPDIAGPDARARMLREAQAMARVAHPNVVGIYEAGVHEDSLFIAMELVRGRALGDWLDDAPRGVRDVLQRLVECGRALAAAHHAQILHRDFKPANVLVGDDGRARVLDFGLACAVRGRDRRGEGAGAADGAADGAALSSELTAHGAIVGTPAYMAPEQFEGDASEKSDQWSFGVTCYRALFGAMPFEADGITALMAAIQFGEPRPPPQRPEVPPAIVAAVMRALAHDPAARWPSIEAMVAALEAELARDPDRDPSRSRRQRRILAASVTTFAFVAGAITAVRSDFGRHATVTDALGQAVLAAVAIVVGTAIFRRRVLRDAHGRGVILWYFLLVVGLVLHRAVNLDTPLPTVLRGDAFAVAVLAVLGGALLERWMGWIVAVMAVYVGVSFVAPVAAFAGFGVAIVSSVALAIWFWREK